MTGPRPCRNSRFFRVRAWVRVVKCEAEERNPARRRSLSARARAAGAGKLPRVAACAPAARRRPDDARKGCCDLALRLLLLLLRLLLRRRLLLLPHALQAGWGRQQRCRSRRRHGPRPSTLTRCGRTLCISPLTLQAFSLRLACLFLSLSSLWLWLWLWLSRMF